jgi:hypothetical protein
LAPGVALSVPQPPHALAFWHALPQINSPPGHAHEPLTHCSPVTVQTLPQDPQLAVSVCVLVQAVPQSVGLPEFGHLHPPPVHVCADGQTLPQDPQLAVSVCVLVQALPQKFGDELEGHAHALDWQVSAAGHAWPQVPQLLPSLESVAQAPLQFA